MGNTTDRKKAVRMTTVNLITEDDAALARNEIERAIMLDSAAEYRAGKLSENAQAVGFDSFSAFARAFADGKLSVNIIEASA